jgi:hypothetical protein
MSELRKSQTFAVLERADQAQFAKTRALFAYWQDLQASGRPTRASLDPVAMKSYLANLLTGNIEPEPFRVLYKLIGTLVADYSQYDFSNRYLDELTYSGRDDVDWESCYRHVHAARRPIVGECTLKGAAGRVIASYEYAVLPLWRDDDPAGSFVAIEVYDGVDSYRIPDWAKVSLKDAGES